MAQGNGDEISDFFDACALKITRIMTESFICINELWLALRLFKCHILVSLNGVNKQLQAPRCCKKLDLLTIVLGNLDAP